MNDNWDEVKELIKYYQPLKSTRELIREMKIVFLVGITGAGKDSIAKVLLEDPKYRRIVSYTTRQPRVNDGVMEKDGEKYHFADSLRVLEMLKEHEFVEAKVVHADVYGTGVRELRDVYDAGGIAIKDLDFQGAMDYHYMSENVKTIFVVPPSYEVWRERLAARHGGTGQGQVDFRKRMESALRELTAAIENEFFQIVVNDDLREAASEIDNVVRNDIRTDVEREQDLEITRKLLARIEAELRG